MHHWPVVEAIFESWLHMIRRLEERCLWGWTATRRLQNALSCGQAKALLYPEIRNGLLDVFWDESSLVLPGLVMACHSQAHLPDDLHPFRIICPGGPHIVD
jgi:hypothetical protein